MENPALVQVHHRSTEVHQILQALGHLDAEQRGLVEALAAQHLKKHDGDAEKSLAAVTVAPSVRRSLAAVADPEINSTLVRLVFTHGPSPSLRFISSFDQTDARHLLASGEAKGCDKRRSRSQELGIDLVSTVAPDQLV